MVAVQSSLIGRKVKITAPLPGLKQFFAGGIPEVELEIYEVAPIECHDPPHEGQLRNAFFCKGEIAGIAFFPCLFPEEVSFTDLE